MFAIEGAGERLIAGLGHDAFPDPLPELRLRGPVLFAIATNDQRRLALLLFLFVFLVRHFALCPLPFASPHTLRPLRGALRFRSLRDGKPHKVPRGEALIARRAGFSKSPKNCESRIANCEITNA